MEKYGKTGTDNVARLFLRTFEHANVLKCIKHCKTKTIDYSIEWSNETSEADAVKWVLLAACTHIYHAFNAVSTNSMVSIYQSMNAYIYLFLIVF